MNVLLETSLYIRRSKVSLCNVCP